MAIIWLARWLLVIARSTLTMSARKTSLAIKPAGSSLPVLIRKPVLSRVKVCWRLAFDRAKDFWALREPTFVLIRVMPDTPC